MKGPRRGLGLVAAAAGLVAALPLKDRGLSLGDEGHLLAIASRLAQGRDVLYRDIATNIPPLCYETLALAFRLLGETIQTERWLGVGLVVVAARASFLLGGSLGGNRGAWVALGTFLGCKGLATPHWSLFYYTEASLTFSLWALSVLMASPRTVRRLAFAGCLVALALGFKQSYGGFAAIVGIVALARGTSPRGRASDLATFLLPSVLLAAALAAQLAAAGALADAWRWNVVYFLGTFARDLRIPYPALAPWTDLWPGRPPGVALFYYLPSCVAADPALWRMASGAPSAAAAAVRVLYLLPAVAALLLARRIAEPAHLFALLSLSALWPLSDFSHYLDATLPAAIVLIAAAAGSEVGPIGAQRGRRHVSVVASGMLLALGSLATARAWGRMGTDVRFGERGHAYLSAGDARNLADAHEALGRHAPPGARLLALPYCPLFYFTGGYENPTPLYLPFPSFLARDEARIVAGAADVDVVILGGGQWPHLPELSASAPRLAALLANDFETVEVAGGMEIRRRRVPAKRALKGEANRSSRATEAPPP